MNQSEPENNLKHSSEKFDYNTGCVTDMKKIPDTELIEKCVQGNRKAQHCLFDAYKEKVYGFVFKTLGTGFDTDDVVQQIFINVFKSLKVFKGNASLDTWVYRIGSKVCTDQLRKKYRKRQIAVVGQEYSEYENSLPDNTTPLSRLENNELHEVLTEAMNLLSIEKRMVLVLYEMEDKNVEDIACIMNIPVGTVKSRLFHGRNDLKKHLKRYIGG